MADVALEGPIGERIRIYRGRRGLSQKELAGLIGRSESWLSQVERGVRSVDKFSVLVDIAQILKTNVETLVGKRMEYAPNGDAPVDGIDAVAAALTAYPGLMHEDLTASTISLEDAEGLADEAHARYQSADYASAARVLARLLPTIDMAVARESPEDVERCLRIQHAAYVAASKLLTKTGDGHLAWLAADRASTAAVRLGSAVLKGLAAYQVTTALLKLDRLAEAERIALAAAESIDDDSPLGISTQGALFLIAAVIAGRRSDRKSANERLRRAQFLAEALGEDGNYGWTAFGPTNVATPPGLGRRRAGRRRVRDPLRRADRHVEPAGCASQSTRSGASRRGMGIRAAQGRLCSRHQSDGDRACRAPGAAIQRGRSRTRTRTTQTRTPDRHPRPARARGTGRSTQVNDRPALYVIGASAPPVRQLADACRAGHRRRLAAVRHPHSDRRRLGRSR